MRRQGASYRQEKRMEPRAEHWEIQSLLVGKSKGNKEETRKVGKTTGGGNTLKTKERKKFQEGGSNQLCQMLLTVQVRIYLYR